MCELECLENEECHYDEENGEYKCVLSHAILEIILWAPVVALAGAFIIGLLIFFIVRHFKNKTKVKNTINVIEKQPDYDSTYELPYRHTTDHAGDQNEAVTIENEETYEAYHSTEYELYDGMYETYDTNNST